MTIPGDHAQPTVVHPVHAALIAGAFPLFLGALLSDQAYSASYQVQWLNFASWLIVGAMVFTGSALLFSAVGLLRHRYRNVRAMVLAALLLATFVLGFINALIHAKDAWATMPDGLVLSAIVAVLSLAATCAGFYRASKEVGV